MAWAEERKEWEKKLNGEGGRGHGEDLNRCPPEFAEGDCFPEEKKDNVPISLNYLWSARIFYCNLLNWTGIPSRVNDELHAYTNHRLSFRIPIVSIMRELANQVTGPLIQISLAGQW